MLHVKVFENENKEIVINEGVYHGQTIGSNLSIIEVATETKDIKGFTVFTYHIILVPYNHIEFIKPYKH